MVWFFGVFVVPDIIFPYVKRAQTVVGIIINKYHG